MRRGRGRHEAEQFHVRFCFPDAATADAFHQRFSGTRLTYSPVKPGRPSGPRVRYQRSYSPRVVDGKIMTPADLRCLHKYMLDIEKVTVISDEMPAVVESEWPRHALFVDAVFGFGPRASGPLREKVTWIAPRWLSQAEDQVLQGGALGRDPNRNCPASAAGPSDVHVGYCPIRHALPEVPDYRRLDPGNRDRQRSPPIGHSVRPDHYRNARLVPLRGGSLTLGSFFELNLSKK